MKGEMICMKIDNDLPEGHINLEEVIFDNLDMGGDIGVCRVGIYTEYNSKGFDNEEPYFFLENDNGFKSCIDIRTNKYIGNCNKLNHEQSKILNDWLNSRGMFNTTNWFRIYGGWRVSNSESDYFGSTQNIYKNQPNYEIIN